MIAFRPILFFTHRFLYLMLGIAGLFVLSFFLPFLFWIASAALTVMGIGALAEIYFLYLQGGVITARRILPRQFSNGDENPVSLHLLSSFALPLHCWLFDEWPAGYPCPEEELPGPLIPGSEKICAFRFRPTTRGDLTFGTLTLHISTPINFFRKPLSYDLKASAPSFPSFIHLPDQAMMVKTTQLKEGGEHRNNRHGQSYEFESLREYALGDDIRHINWKASARTDRMVVNQYQEERSQSIYCIIDKGRTMQRHFDGMSLLEYAINAALALCHLSLIKYDLAGLITFNRTIDAAVPASRRSGQLQLISETLYNATCDFADSDFEQMFLSLHHQINHRSLLFLFTNFESLSGMKRQYSYLLSLSKRHRLVVIIFDDTELRQSSRRPTEDIEQIYINTIVARFMYEKVLLVKELNKMGISALLTAPGDISADVINKYLAMKKSPW